MNKITDTINFNIYRTSNMENYTDMLLEVMTNLDIINNKSKAYYSKRNFVRNLLANLIVSFLSNRYIIYSRDRSEWTIHSRYGKLFMKYSVMVPIIDKFVQLGYLEHYKGIYDKVRKHGYLSRMRPTEKLVSIFDRYWDRSEIHYFPKDDPDEVIILKDEKNKAKVLYTDTRKISRARNFVLKYNSFIKNFEVCCSANEIGLTDKQLDRISRMTVGGIISNVSIVRTDSRVNDGTLRVNSLKSASHCYLTNYISYNNNSSSNNNSNNNNNTYTTTTTLTQTVYTFNVSMLLNYLSLHRVYNRRNFSCNGRFYGSSHIGIPKVLRPFISIDNEPTVELDYSALHIRMLYHKINIDYQDDPYIALCDCPEDRKYLKIIMLIAINHKVYSGIPFSVQKYIKRKREAGEDLHQLTRKKIGEYLIRFKEQHKPIAHFIGADIGIKLQNIDSEIMERVLKQCVNNNIPALPVHDSVIVPASKKEFLYETMLEEYKKVMGFYPVVK